MIAKGNKRAFSILYGRYLSVIYNYIYFQVNGNHHDTEDLTEEVFLRAFTVILEKPKKQSNFKALLYRIAHNLVIDQYRTKKVELDIEAASDVSDNFPNPEDNLETAQLSEELTKAIKKLKPNLQSVIIMRYVLDMDTTEIAEFMGISKNYVRVLQFRALQAMKIDY
jgi:RNA polymerase sigma-70 factor (ECF subfamily)